MHPDDRANEDYEKRLGEKEVETTIVDWSDFVALVSLRPINSGRLLFIQFVEQECGERWSCLVGRITPLTRSGFICGLDRLCATVQWCAVWYGSNRVGNCAELFGFCRKERGMSAAYCRGSHNGMHLCRLRVQLDKKLLLIGQGISLTDIFIIMCIPRPHITNLCNIGN